MKHTIILLSSFLFIGLASCKTKSKTQSTNTDAEKKSNTTVATTTTQPESVNTVSDKACAAEMAFGSAGSGIDGPSYDKAIALMNEKKVKFTKKNIGREGEKLICLPLTELKEAEKKDFIEQLKKIAASGQMVSLSVR